MFTALAAFLFFFLTNRSDSIVCRRGFLVSSDLFLAVCAMYCCYHHNVQNSVSYYGRYLTAAPQHFECTVTSLPQDKEKFCKIKVELNAIRASEHLLPVTGETLLYIKKPLDFRLPQPGDQLTVYGRFNVFNEPLNPHEFNYKSFLANKNIFYQCFTDTANVKFHGENNDFSLQVLGLKIKQRIIEKFKNSGLNLEAANLCIALLTGYDEEIGPETVNAFAHSGTLHVLSVSGLHTGILYAVLVFAFGLLDPNKKFRFLQVVMIIAVLFGFALIAGFSPPVSRAMIMLSLLVIGRTYFNFGTENSLNILAVSAFAMLFFDPLLLFDTGFLLSYLAIIGIMFYAPAINDSIDAENTVLKKTWQLVSVSLAAQVTTLPLTLLLFHQFPIWFIFSNLLVIPLCTVLMFLAFLLLIKLVWVELLINLGTKLIYWLVGLTDAPGWGYIDAIDFNGKDVFMLSAIIFLLSVFAKYRSYVSLVSALLILMFWQTNSILEVSREKTQSVIGIYQVQKTYAMDVKNKNLLLHSSKGSENDYNFHVKPNHTTFNYPGKVSMNIDYVKTRTFSVFHLKHREQLGLIKFLQPDYLVVSGSAEPGPGMLKDLNKLKLLVADGSNTYKQARNLMQLCRKFGYDFYNTRESGFLGLVIEDKMRRNESKDW
jgi:competence protein ComEC